METDIKNLQQEVLRLTLRLIALENKPSFVGDINIMIDKLSIRIGVLEEGRRSQIRVNADIEKRVNNYSTILAKPSGVSMAKKFWPF